MGNFFSSSNSQYAPQANTTTSAPNTGGMFPNDTNTMPPSQTDQPMNPDLTSNSVQVPSSTKCALCSTVSVDTQLRPCGHMFHGRCLKPSLQNALGPPKCPLCDTSMQSAILAVPTAAPVEDGHSVGV